MKSSDNKILKDSLQQTKLTASDNFKHRIMQQIQTEVALRPKRKTSNYSVLRSFMSTLAVMYGLIAFVAFFVFQINNITDLNNTSFLLSSIAIASVCFIYFGINSYDEYRRHKIK